MTPIPVHPTADAITGPAAGMIRVDLSASSRLPILMQMVGALSRATEPSEVLQAYANGLRKLEGPRGYVSLSTRGLLPGEYRITRMIFDDELPIADADPWRNGDALPVHTGGLFGDLIRQAYPSMVHDLFLRDDPVVGNALSEYGSLMAIPLFDDGQPLNWAILLQRDARGHTVNDLEEAVLRANLVGATVRNVLAAQQLRVANARVQREVEQIARIQRALLPPGLPDIPGVKLGAHFETFDEAGGDLYDLKPLRLLPSGEPDPNGPWGMHIADAAGHGPAAATVVAMLNAIISASPGDESKPGELLTFANHHLVGKKLEGSFVTAICARYDPTSRRFTYARAGHNPLLRMRRDENGVEIERLEHVGSIPLGVADDIVYEEESIQLRPGDTIVFYTDGITEARAPGGEQFQVEGIERSLTECSGEPDCVIGHVTEALRAHEAGERPGDDQTLLVMRVDG